jgi:hypothetical protein
MNDTDAKTEKINNVPVGTVSYPDPDDLVLALVWVTDMADANRIHPEIQQHPQMEVIILSRVIWNHPEIGPYDNIIGDKSGARLHLNHGWLDETNVKDLDEEYLEDQEAARPHQLRTGHVTLVGNRHVRLAGQKFLPFGLFSHLIGQAKSGRSLIVFPSSSDPEQDDSGEGQGTKWDKIFTQDPTDGAIFSGLLNTGLADGKFLEPPCPEPGTMMDMHDSGFKHLVEVNGHVRQYIPKGAVIVIGEDSSDTNKKTSFDPNGMSESSTYPEQNEGNLLVHFIESGSDNDIKVEVDPATDVITITMASGLVFEIDGANDTIDITTTGGAGSGKITFDGDFEVTGEVKGGTGTFG